MDPQVLLEVDGEAEGFGALLALEGFLSSVAELVCFERDGAGEAFPADAADEELAGVDVFVAVQVLQHAEGSAAHLAGVRLLSGVRPQVKLQTRTLGERSAADAAGVWPLFGVCAAVQEQAGALGECLTALQAFVWTLACVDSLVDLQVGRLVEGLPTDATDVSLVALRVADWPHAAVDPAVVLEVGLLAEGSGALVTFEGFQSAVAELVCFQREGAGEAFPADAAHEDLLAGVGVSVAVQVLQHAEMAAAHLTGVRLLSGVDPHVNGQTVLLIEPSAADTAAERLLDAVDH